MVLHRVLLSEAPRWPTAPLSHGDVGVGPWAWHWEPTVIGGIVALSALYLHGVSHARRHGRPFQYTRVVSFVGGTTVLMLALVSPLDVLGERFLFSAHMVQHILISIVVPPLWLVGMKGLSLPGFTAGPALVVGRAITHPVAAFVIFNAVFWGWHWPQLYDAVLADEHLHIVQHLSFVAAGVVSWWPVFSPMCALPGLPSPKREFYLFACCQPGVALGALFVFSRDTIYRAYGDAPELFGLTPLGDQQLGGLIMWVPGNALYLIVLSLLFLRWMLRNEPNGLVTNGHLTEER